MKHARVARDALVTDFVVVGKFADGSESHAFVATRRQPPVADGFAAAFWDDGTLRHFGYYEAGACVASVDLHPPSEHGVFAQGRKMRTGEVYVRGTLETLSPWSDNDAATPTEQTFEDWVVDKVEGVRRSSP
ncbi:MAG TPA: hypothetical protein VGH28_27495 [Polyangiaceae bacterium]